jgi:hypothetical protein
MCASGFTTAQLPVERAPTHKFHKRFVHTNSSLNLLLPLPPAVAAAATAPLPPPPPHTHTCALCPSSLISQLSTR